MNINELSLTNNYQQLSFNGSKSKTVKSVKKGVSTCNTTLKDIFDLKKRKQNESIFTYDKLVKECEELDRKAALKKQQEAFAALVKALEKQAEIESKTYKGFFTERAKYQKGIFDKLIARCFEDIDKAVLSKASQEKIDKLTETLEMFIKKFSHYGKAL